MTGSFQDGFMFFRAIVVFHDSINLNKGTKLAWL